MLNARLYRTSWLVAGVALVVALLTLQSPAPPPAPTTAPTVDAGYALRVSRALAALGPRPPGSPVDDQAAQFVRRELSSLPAGTSRAQVQEFSARAGGAGYRLTNVYVAVPPSGAAPLRRGILVVAARDTPPGVSAGATSTGILVELARVATTIPHRRPLLFVSTDGSTLGNAGMRWFLTRFSEFPLAAAVVLDAPGEALGTGMDVWAGGRGGGQALGLSSLTSDVLTAAGARVKRVSSLSGQLLRLAVPQTFGEQGPTIGTGVSAVTLAGRPESPLRPGAEPTAPRMAFAAGGAEQVLLALDSADEVPSPDGSLLLAGKVLRPVFVRVALLLLALPILVLAADAWTRARRGRVPVLLGVRALGWRAVPPLGALLLAHLLVLTGVLPAPAAGAPPLPQAVPFDAAGAGGLVAAGVCAFLLWRVARRHIGWLGVSAPGEAVGALSALAVLLVALWILRPYALVLVLPAAHAALLATVAPRRWHLLALAAIAVLPVLALFATVGGILHRNPLYAAWYLLETTAAGARGFVGPVLGIGLGVAVWALGGLAAFRARKGLVTEGPARATR
jgi:hypothetical protein